MADLSDYLGLIPSANREQPNFQAALAATLQPIVDATNVAASLPSKLDVDLAAGDQLDAVGEWVNLSRVLAAPIANVYFAFNTAGLGFNQGLIYNSSLPPTGLIALDDSTFRAMIRLKIAANAWDGSMGEANAALVEAFGSQGDPPVVWITDNFDMTMSYHITGNPHSALLEQLVLGGYMPFRAAGVALI